MTAPATPRIPTPGDLARRTPVAPPTPPTAPRKPTGRTRRAASATPPSVRRPLTAEEFIAPGVLMPNESLRPLYQQGLRISRMLPAARLTALTLLGYANFKTGLLNSRQPNTEQLSYATGLDQAQVLVQIEILTQRGWLTIRRLTRGPRIGRDVFQLCIPAGVLQQLRDRTDATT